MFRTQLKSVLPTITWPGKGLLLALLLASAVTQAIEVQGSAPLGGAGRLSSARTAAIRDALDNASLAGETRVQGSTSEDKGNTLRVRGQAIASYSLQREWQEGDSYRVILDVQFEPSSLESQKICSRTAYRRKVLTTHFHFQHPAQAPDISNFPDGLAAELTRRLYASKHYLADKSSNETPLQLTPYQAEPVVYPDTVRDLARRHGVQFVVSGIVRDATMAGERYTTRHGTDLRPTERKRILNVPFLNFTEFGLVATAATRRFELELFVFDGISGALINRHILSGRAEGEVVMSPSFSVTSDSFFATDFGKLVDGKLNEAVQQINSDLLCLPFSARVTKVENGQVYFDAGGTSLLAPGDELRIYRLKPRLLPVDGSSQYQPLRRGQPEYPVGTLTVSEVQPLFSVGIADPDSLPEVGDYIRFTGEEKKQ